MKKKIHNGNRKKKAELVEEKMADENTNTDANQEPVDETMIKHLQTTLSMLEERKVSRREVLELIERMRQRSIAMEKEVRYLGGKSKKESG
jgi:hypothetical protein